MVGLSPKKYRLTSAIIVPPRAKKTHFQWPAVSGRRFGRYLEFINAHWHWEAAILHDVVCSRYVEHWYYWMRPYHPGSTSSRPIWEVKQVRARLVLRWVTTLEHRVLHPFFLLLIKPEKQVLHFVDWSLVMPSPICTFIVTACHPRFAGSTWGAGEIVFWIAVNDNVFSLKKLGDPLSLRT